MRKILDTTFLVPLAQPANVLAQQRHQQIGDLVRLTRTEQPLGQSVVVSLRRGSACRTNNSPPSLETSPPVKLAWMLRRLATENSNEASVQTVTPEPPWLNGLNTIGYSDLEEFRHFSLCNIRARDSGSCSEGRLQNLAKAKGRSFDRPLGSARIDNAISGGDGG